MAKQKTQFELFLENEVNKVKGVSYPVKAGFFRRNFTKQAPCTKLHPNPNDEFCDPAIGPNPTIISNYIEAMRGLKGSSPNTLLLSNAINEPLVVEKIYPDGYMILNGHHRWAAASRIGIRKLPIRITDLTQKEDLQKMLKKAGSDRRVTLDLDETVFGSKESGNLEKPLSFPFSRHFRERLRLGVPALFHYLSRQGYDIWVYSARYHSLSYIRSYFRHYHIKVTGIVTGTARKGPAGNDTLRQLEQMLDSQYRSTVHIDSHMVLCTSKGSKDYQEYPLSSSDDGWSLEVMNVIGEKLDS